LEKNIKTHARTLELQIAGWYVNNGERGWTGTKKYLSEENERGDKKH
jgi:hypothetical protein